MKEVIILTEAGSKFGYGHLTRCLALAQGFKVKGIESLFFIKGDLHADDIPGEFKYIQFDWTKEKVEVKGKILIIDSYYADGNFCKKVYEEAETVLFIDDYNRIPYPGGFVLNSVLGADIIGYPINPEITYLLGPEYHPLRREFWDVPVKVIREKVMKILITFGGSDMTNETPSVLKMLHDRYPDLEKHVIIGSGFSNINNIKDEADDKTFLIIKPDAEGMRHEMIDCDIAISAAGQTIYELARVGITTFAKKVAENQDNIIHNWKAIGFLLDFSLSDKIPDYYSRNAIYNTGRSIIDGQGVHRIVEKLANDHN